MMSCQPRSSSVGLAADWSRCRRWRRRCRAGRARATPASNAACRPRWSRTSAWRATIRRSRSSTCLGGLARGPRASPSGTARCRPARRVEGDDVGALLREPQRVAAALPPRCAGDERDLAVELSHARGSLAFDIGVPSTVTHTTSITPRPDGRSCCSSLASTPEVRHGARRVGSPPGRGAARGDRRLRRAPRAPSRPGARLGPARRLQRRPGRLRGGPARPRAPSDRQPGVGRGP